MAVRIGQRGVRSRQTYRPVLDSIVMNETGIPMERPHVAALDAILGRPFRMLDDGFVRVVDYMGSDESIVQAARVSYGAGTKRIHEDRGLIRYLMRHRHTTPFEMCEIKFHVRVPMDCWRQWIRHRTANVNEYSTRYSVAIDAAQRTKPGEWRLQSQKQQAGERGIPRPCARGRVLGEGSRATDGRAQGLRGAARGGRSRASRRGRTCRSRPTPRPTGRSTYTTCSTS